MQAKWIDYEPTLRDKIISRARYGELTPEQAEAEAVANGLEPFERQPEQSDFDPLQESRWSIVMAVAWIAWRDLKLVREQSAEFRSQSTLWFFRHWNEPTSDGTEFVAREGWFLETSEATTMRLSLLEKILERRENLPSTARLSVAGAEQVLWRALSDGKLVAEALSSEGLPVDIPQREWSFLKLFEEGKRDALKYDPLDRREPYTAVKLKRDDLMKLWPAPAPAPASDEAWAGKIEPYMFEPVSRRDAAGYVPLCAALHWIVTRGGLLTLTLADEAAWKGGVEELLPLICSGEVELNGLPRGRALADRIPGHTLTLVRVLAPLRNSIADFLLDAPSHIVCTPYSDEEYWSKTDNDMLYERGEATATWTHLQVKKSDLLSRWPRPEATVKAQTDCYHWLSGQMKASPNQKPKSRDAFWNEAASKFGPLSKRQFIRAWDTAVSESGAQQWSKAGRLPTKSNRRAD